MNSTRCSKSRRLLLLRYNEGSVLITQQRFASGEENYRKSEPLQ